MAVVDRISGAMTVLEVVVESGRVTERVCEEKLVLFCEISLVIGLVVIIFVFFLV